MPFCDAGSGRDVEVKIFYRTYGHGVTKVLLINGLAGTHDGWGPQIKGLTGTESPNDDEPTPTDRDSGEVGDREGNGRVEACAFDNRGLGRSSVPTRKSEYTTKIMANDAIALLDHLSWGKSHIIGHSLGAMVACKLAALVPQRVLSLAMLNVTGGGFQCFPKLEKQTISIAIRFLRAKTPEQRAAVDLDTHYTKEYLEEYVGSDTRRGILYKQYVRRLSSRGMQSNYGFDGQINACWTHRMSSSELESICSSRFLVSIIHGRHDVIAQMCYARKLAEKLQPSARMVELHGGHLVSHERTTEVNQALCELIQAAEARMSPGDWTNLPEEGSVGRGGADGIMRWLRICLLYILSLLAMVVKYARRSLRSWKPVGVSSVSTRAS